MGNWKNSVTHPKSRINRKRKRKWGKKLVRFVGNLSRIPKLSFFYSSIKTEGVLFFFIYIAIYIYICIYIKNQALNGKMFRNKKCFFRFYILYENFSKIGPIIKKIPKFWENLSRSLDKFKITEHFNYITLWTNNIRSHIIRSTSNSCASSFEWDDLSFTTE